MGNRRNFLIAEIVKYSQKLDQKGFTANHDGNISAKLDDVLLATPTAVSKGNIVADMIIILDSSGKKIEGIGNSFSEIKLHLTAYQARPDAKAVIHAHPPFTTARGLANLSLEPQLPEAIVSIGNNIPVAEFAMPGVPENDAIIAKALSISDVFMLPGNGVLAIGDDVEQAYLRIELVEHLAKIEFYAKQMGTPMQLREQDVQKLLDKRKSIGLGPQARAISQIGECPPKLYAKEDSIKTDALKDLIAEEIKKILKE